MEKQDRLIPHFNLNLTMSPTKFKPGYKYKVIVTEMNGSYQYNLTETGKKSLVEGASISLFGE